MLLQIEAMHNEEKERKIKMEQEQILMHIEIMYLPRIHFLSLLLLFSH
jgi:hypothetical protein